MHKKLLTILIGTGVSLGALQAMAEDAASGPSVKITGNLKSLAVGSIQKVRSSKGMQFNTSGNMTFNAGGVANNGLTYGALAVLELDRMKAATDRISEAYVYVGSDAIGNFQFGDTNGVSSIMMYDATDVMGGTGGFDGNLEKQLNVTRGVDFGQSIGYVIDGSSRSTKINYISPEVSGWQTGFSYTPDTAQYGRVPNTKALDATGKVYSRSAPYALNHVEGGLSFTEDVGAYTVGVYLVGALGKAHAPNPVSAESLNPVKAWQFGTLIDYQNYQFGAGYFNNGKYYMRRSTNFTNTHGFNLAMSYGMGPVSLALGYTGTERTVTAGKAKADISSFTVDYSVADGLAVYGEASYFKFRAPDAHIAGTNFVAATDYLDRQPATNKDNSGTAFVLGTRINF